MGINKAHGATELLEWLQQKNIPAMVVSNKSGEMLRQEAVLLDWNKYFASIVGAHDAPLDKPAREHADRALDLAGIEGGPDIWFVGDSETDIQCARNVECMPVLIGSCEDARRLGVEAFFPDCHAVLESMKKMLTKEQSVSSRV